MDPITHALTGYAISKAVYKQGKNKDDADIGENKPSLKALSVATILGAISPDIDIVTSFFGGATAYFMNHRGITHSPLGIILLSVVCAFLARFLTKTKSFKELWGAAFIGTLSHVLFDLTNVYSTLALWPFSTKMFSFGVMPIVDPFVLFFFVMGLVLTSITRFKVYSRRIFTAVLTVLLVYITSRVYIQQDLKYYLMMEYQNNKVTSFSSQNTYDKTSIMAGSTLNTWSFIIENQNEFIKGNISFYPHHYENIMKIEKKPINEAMKNAVKNPLGQFLLRFSPYIGYSVENYKDGYLVKMADLRYSNIKDVTPNQNQYGGNSLHHFLGGYTILDKNYNTLYWGITLPEYKG